MEMKQIADVRTNLFYTKEGEEYIKMFEVIMLLDCPTYRRTNDGSIVRERSIEEVRIMVTPKNAETLSKLFDGLKDITESDLT